MAKAALEKDGMRAAGKALLFLQFTRVGIMGNVGGWCELEATATRKEDASGTMDGPTLPLIPPRFGKSYEKHPQEAIKKQ